jgi:Fe-S oxidoreductase
VPSFFPVASSPEYGPRRRCGLYDRLLELEPQTGIWLDCCAAPAHWSGRAEEFKELARKLETIWIGMGGPKVVTACSTCLKMFREHLPQLGAVSVWTVLAGESVPAAAAHPALALSDPCTSRHDEGTRKDVRALLENIGQPLAALPMSGELTECCGFGGLMDNASPALARKVAAAAWPSPTRIF